MVTSTKAGVACCGVIGMGVAVGVGVVVGVGVSVGVEVGEGDGVGQAVGMGAGNGWAVALAEMSATARVPAVEALIHRVASVTAPSRMTRTRASVKKRMG